MKKTNIFIALMVGLAFTACQDSMPELESMPEKSAIKYSVTQPTNIDAGGNTVVLKNNTPGVIAVWDYGTGRSTRDADTVRFAFKGTYTIKFSAMTAGGIVKCDDVVVNVTKDNLMYVNDPLWTALSGGVGKEKTWYLDVDANGVSRFFMGPLFFYGTSMIWAGACNGTDCWNWNPDYKGNTWLMTAGDYGSMTFSLKGGPNVTVNHKMLSKTESGSYFLDANAKTLTMTDARPLHDAGRDAVVLSWGKIQLLSLTENSMQLGVIRDNSSEGKCYLVYNFISKDYYDNWVPPVEGDPNFDFGNQKDLLSVSSTKVWKPDTNVPYNWTNLKGEMLNAWNSRADIIASGWAPYGDADVTNIDGVSLAFSSDGKAVFTADNGTVTTGTYKVDETTNMITFKDVTPSFTIAGWASASTTDANQWKIVKIEKNAAGSTTGVWFGKRDPNKAEYQVFHFLLAAK
jgi:hypothetical protein